MAGRIKGSRNRTHKWVYDSELYRQRPKPEDAFTGVWERVRLPLRPEDVMRQLAEIEVEAG
jgi:hypothetical protein